MDVNQRRPTTADTPHSPRDRRLPANYPRAGSTPRSRGASSRGGGFVPEAGLHGQFTQTSVAPKRSSSPRRRVAAPLGAAVQPHERPLTGTSPAPGQRRVGQTGMTSGGSRPGTVGSVTFALGGEASPRALEAAAAAAAPVASRAPVGPGARRRDSGPCVWESALREIDAAKANYRAASPLRGDRASANWASPARVTDIRKEFRRRGNATNGAGVHLSGELGRPGSARTRPVPGGLFDTLRLKEMENVDYGASSSSCGGGGGSGGGNSPRTSAASPRAMRPPKLKYNVATGYDASLPAQYSPRWGFGAAGRHGDTAKFVGGPFRADPKMKIGCEYRPSNGAGVQDAYASTVRGTGHADEVFMGTLRGGGGGAFDARNIASDPFMNTVGRTMKAGSGITEGIGEGSHNAFYRAKINQRQQRENEFYATAGAIAKGADRKRLVTPRGQPEPPPPPQRLSSPDSSEDGQ